MYIFIFPKIFYSYMDETRCVRLISLSSKENRYAFNFNCKIYFKNILDSNKAIYPKFKYLLLNKNFITQYFK